MPLLLSSRAQGLSEKMDDPGCNRQQLFNTYRQFSHINSLLSRWRRVYTRYIKPFAQSNGGSFSLLDIGFGGGDIPLKLARWCNNDGIEPNILAIDTDDRALAFSQQLEVPPTVAFRQCSSSELVRQGAIFDFVISNHLLHHLESEELQKLLPEAEQLSRHQVLFNDIERSDLGYLLFSTLSRPLFRHSFITEDGLTSIKRSFTRPELAREVPASWQVHRLFPYRLLLTFTHA